MFSDSNENGILDKDDILISKGKVVEGFEDVKPGKLLSKRVDGVITAKPFESHSHDHDHNHDDHGHDISTGINALGIEHLSLLNADGAMVIHDHGDAHNHDHSMM